MAPSLLRSPGKRQGCMGQNSKGFCSKSEQDTKFLAPICWMHSSSCQSRSPIGFHRAAKKGIGGNRQTFPFPFCSSFSLVPLAFSRSWYLACSVSRTCEGKQGKGRFFALFPSTILRSLSVSLSPEQAREIERGKNQLSSVFSLFFPRHMAPLSIFCEERKRIRMQKKVAR